MPRKPENPQIGQHIGRSQTDNADAKEESHAAGMVDRSGLLALPSPASATPAAPPVSILADELFGLFEDVRALKARAMDSVQAAREIQELRIELKEMKSQMHQLAVRGQDINCGSLNDEAGTECEKPSTADPSPTSREKQVKGRFTSTTSKYSMETIASSKSNLTTLSRSSKSDLTLASQAKSVCSFLSPEHLSEINEHAPRDATATQCVDDSGYVRPLSLLAHGSRAITQQPSNVGKPKYAPGFEEVFSGVAMTVGGFPKLDSRLHDLCAQDATYDFSDTIWDILTFCGLEPLALVDQLCVISVALLNLVVQAGFIALVWTTMLENDFSSNGIIQELTDWRVLYAHNPDYADAFTDQSLAEEICGNSFLRMEGASQAALFNDLDDYTQSFLSMPCGGLLSLLSIFLWLLTCAREWKKACMFLIGIWTPNDTTKRSIWEASIDASFVQVLDKPLVWYAGECRHKTYQIFLAPNRALIVSVLVFLPRTIILVLLGAVGCSFLAQTVHLSELILNAVALDVVLNVDELLFDILAPSAARRLIAKTLPLRVPRKKGTCARAAHLIFMGVVAMTLMLVGLYCLEPLVKTMTDAKRIMCDGDVQFLAFQLPYGPIAAVQPSSNAVDRSLHKYRAIYQRARLTASINAQDSLCVSGGIYRLRGSNQVVQAKQWRDRSISDVAKLDLNNQQSLPCGTVPNIVVPSQRNAMWMGVGSMVGNESLQSCDDVVHLCLDSSLAGSVTRLVCSQACGAQDSLSGLYLDTTKDGVPDLCRWEHIRNLWYHDTCTDADITHSVAAFRYAKGFISYWEEWLTRDDPTNYTHVVVLQKWLLQKIQAQGCNLFLRSVKLPTVSNWSYPVTVDFCDPFDSMLQGRRTVRAFCPQTCKCDSSAVQAYKHLVAVSLQHVLEQTQCPGECIRQLVNATPASYKSNFSPR